MFDVAFMKVGSLCSTCCLLFRIEKWTLFLLQERPIADEAAYCGASDMGCQRNLDSLNAPAVT